MDYFGIFGVLKENCIPIGRCHPIFNSNVYAVYSGYPACVSWHFEIILVDEKIDWLTVDSVCRVDAVEIMLQISTPQFNADLVIFQDVT
jgi:hypothetical protein